MAHKGALWIAASFTKSLSTVDTSGSSSTDYFSQYGIYHYEISSGVIRIHAETGAVEDWLPDALDYAICEDYILYTMEKYVTNAAGYTLYLGSSDDALCDCSIPDLLAGNAEWTMRYNDSEPAMMFGYPSKP